MAQNHGSKIFERLEARSQLIILQARSNRSAWRRSKWGPHPVDNRHPECAVQHRITTLPTRSLPHTDPVKNTEPSVNASVNLHHCSTRREGRWKPRRLNHRARNQQLRYGNRRRWRRRKRGFARLFESKWLVSLKPSSIVFWLIDSERWSFIYDDDNIASNFMAFEFSNRRLNICMRLKFLFFSINIEWP